MKLTWIGHSCFLLESGEGTCVFDPFAPGSVPGLMLPELEADMCLCSHGHRDHAYADGVKLSGKKCGLTAERAETFHDDRGGALRGKNTVYTVTAEGMRVTHLGDLGHIPDAETYAKIGRPDVLLIPVGGYYTIDAAAALEIAEKLNARIVVPMHYRGEGFGYDVISTADEFIAACKDPVRYDTNSLVITPDTKPMTAILKCVKE